MYSIIDELSKCFFMEVSIMLVVARMVILLALLGSSAKDLFSASITENVAIKLKKDMDYIVEPLDRIPR